MAAVLVRMMPPPGNPDGENLPPILGEVEVGAGGVRLMRLPPSFRSESGEPITIFM